MRGSRIWFALAMNWIAVFGLLVAGNYHAAFFVVGILVIILSFFIVSGEMKWWRDDTDRLEACESQLRSTAMQLNAYRKLLIDAPVIK